MEFDPKKPAAQEYFALRFTRQLATGITIVSAVWTCTVVSGTDAAAAAMISGPAVIVGDKVSTLVIDGVDGVQYCLECMATFSDGQRVPLCATLWVRSNCDC